VKNQITYRCTDKSSDGYYSKSAKNSVALSVDINPVNML